MTQATVHDVECWKNYQRGLRAALEAAWKMSIPEGYDHVERYAYHDCLLAVRVVLTDLIETEMPDNEAKAD